MTTAQKDWIRIFRPIKNKFAPVKTLGTSVAENEDETFYQKKKGGITCSFVGYKTLGVSQEKFN